MVGNDRIRFSSELPSNFIASRNWFCIFSARERIHRWAYLLRFFITEERRYGPLSCREIRGVPPHDKYDTSTKYRLVEEYGHNSFTEQEDRSLYTQWGFTRPDDAAAWFLGFGNQVKVLAPPEMAERMKNALESKIYTKHDIQMSCQTVENPSESSRGPKPSRISIVPSGMYGGHGRIFAAENPIFQSKNRFLAVFAPGNLKDFSKNW